MEIKPIETFYNGYRFRSRLEARWAVFFDTLGVKYEYEPEGYKLPSGKCYLPDFKIKCYGTRGFNIAKTIKNISPCNYCERYKYSNCEYAMPIINQYECENFTRKKPFDLFIEVKGEMTQEDAEKITEFAFSSGVKGKFEDQPSVLIVGNIPDDNYSGQSWDLKSYDDMNGISIYPWNYYLIDGDYFACYPAVDNVGHFYLDGDDCSYDTMHYDGYETIRNAFRKARQARFEHGEVPN